MPNLQAVSHLKKRLVINQVNRKYVDEKLYDVLNTNSEHTKEILKKFKKAGLIKD